MRGEALGLVRTWTMEWVQPRQRHGQGILSLFHRRDPA